MSSGARRRWDLRTPDYAGPAAGPAAATRHRGAYRDSIEELVPHWRGDPRSAALLALAAAAVLARPSARNWFAGGAVSAYALTPEAWSRIRAHAARDQAGLEQTPA